YVRQLVLLQRTGTCGDIILRYAEVGLKKLIIAEKPSLMRAVMHALAKSGERFAASGDKEYYESSSYVATAQFGHLLELKYPEEYEGRVKRSWNTADLPFFPDKYEYKIKESSAKRYKTIGKLLRRDDVDGVIHCGDPDREGQILVDLVLRQLGNDMPVSRPQLKALTDDAILEALRTAEDNSHYRDLFNEGMTRMCFDWDFGINLSQYATVKTGARPALNVGRVIGAICTEIYNRDKAIEEFVPQDYYKVISDIKDGFRLVSAKRFDGKDAAGAEDYARRLQSGDSVVTDIVSKDVVKKPPKLFSQTSLQSAMSGRHSFKPDRTLSAAQKLYEKGLISYPRTNTEYIAEEEKGSIRKVINMINDEGLLSFRDSRQIFDDSKIDGHSAITVTGKKPSGLSDDEQKCYNVILNRFKAVFCSEPCVYSKTTVTIDNPLERFKVSGEVPVKQGWQRFEPPSNRKKSKDRGEDGNEEDGDEMRVLPPVRKGDKVETDFKAVKAETKPPAHYTVSSLGKWMENPFRKEDSTDEEDYRNILAGLEIGTVATRASIIKKATDKGYISLKGKTYHIEPRGRFLVESCGNLGIDFSAQMTADMGRRLKAVGKGESGVMEVLKANRDEISRVISEDRETAGDSFESRVPSGYRKKEKLNSQIYEPTGEEISFSREWGGHEFTEEETAALLAGGEISFDIKTRRGRKMTVQGTLQKQTFKGHTFWGFKMNEPEFPAEWGGHVFTEEEKEILLSGKKGAKIHAEDLWSERKKKNYAAYLVRKNGRIKPIFEKKSK
ncbi:MAG: hypothetical protein E7220_04615, partial [Clostridiales bacterium]|nr:hypothetical protein [Clostridiales bacterium]